MSYWVRRSSPDLPPARRYNSGRPAYAADVARLLEAVGHLAGWRRRPVAAYVVSADPTTAAVSGPPPPVMSAVTHVLRHNVTPLGRYLALHLDYCADDEGSGNPAITVSLQDSGGTPLDVGTTWAQDSGTLPGGVFARWNSSVLTYLPLAVHGTRLPGPDEATAGAPSAPRMLDCSTIYGTGGLVDLVVETNGARLLSLTVEEYPERTIG